MRSPYAADLQGLRTRILARLDGGEPLAAVCRSPGMPIPHTVRDWARADAAFGHALAAAQRRGTWRRQWQVDEAKAAAFLARARAGEPMRSLFGQPGMPSRQDYRRWKLAQAWFAEAAFALRNRRDAQLGARGRARRRAFDPAVADAIVVRLNRGGEPLEALLAAMPEAPCKPTLRRWRREQPDFDQALRAVMGARRRKPKPVPPAVVEALVDHIVEGGSFASFARRPGTPCRRTLTHWLRDPAFARAVAMACDDREEGYRDRIAAVALDMPHATRRDLARAAAPLSRQLARLTHRPGTPHRRRDGA